MTSHGIRVELQNPIGSVDYPRATGAKVGPDGSLVVIRVQPPDLDETLDDIPRERWWSWSRYAELGPAE